MFALPPPRGESHEGDHDPEHEVHEDLSAPPSSNLLPSRPARHAPPRAARRFEVPAAGGRTEKRCQVRVFVTTNKTA
eukprot:8339388-Pyramimonas_sp.AAC.1